LFNYFHKVFQPGKKARRDTEGVKRAEEIETSKRGEKRGDISKHNGGGKKWKEVYV